MPGIEIKGPVPTGRIAERSGIFSGVEAVLKAYGIDFRDRHLEYAVLDGAYIEAVDLTFAHLKGSSLKGVTIKGSPLLHADLSKTNLDGASLGQVDLRYTDLAGAHAYDVDFFGADLTQSQLEGAWIYHSDLRVSSLSHANLTGAWLADDKLAGADLSGARLIATLFYRCDIVFADLQYVAVTAASFVGGSLHGSQFGIAEGDTVEFESVDLQGALCENCADRKVVVTPGDQRPNTDGVRFFEDDQVASRPSVEWLRGVFDVRPAAPSELIRRTSKLKLRMAEVGCRLEKNALNCGRVETPGLDRFCEGDIRRCWSNSPSKFRVKLVEALSVLICSSSDQDLVMLQAIVNGGMPGILSRAGIEEASVLVANVLQASCSVSEKLRQADQNSLISTWKSQMKEVKSFVDVRHR